MQERRLIEEELRETLKNDMLLLYYQPQIDLATGDVVGLELVGLDARTTPHLLRFLVRELEDVREAVGELAATGVGQLAAHVAELLLALAQCRFGGQRTVLDLDRVLGESLEVVVDLETVVAANGRGELGCLLVSDAHGSPPLLVRAGRVARSVGVTA